MALAKAEVREALSYAKCSAFGVRPSPVSNLPRLCNASASHCVRLTLSNITEFSAVLS